jgi:hypothetical protein
MTRAAVDRREWLTWILGTPAACLSGCSRPAIPRLGELFSPDFSSGHRIRDQLELTTASESRSVGVAIVGGGIAGLATAWRLRREGFEDLAIFEIDSKPGGTSRGEHRGAFAFPWGAHYVPVPMKENRSLIELLSEMSVIVGVSPNGQPIVDEAYLCRDPQERVFVDSHWVEGLYPSADSSGVETDQLQRFQEVIRSCADRRDEHGRRMFAIPMSGCADLQESRELDRISMAQWMDEQGFTSEPLRWLVDYSCRDDYGLTIDQSSAWAGIFYFASRLQSAEEDSQDVITWPEGNGRVVDYLTRDLGDRLISGGTVVSISAEGVGASERYRVMVLDSVGRSTQWSARRVVFAAPQFVAPHVIQDDRFLKRRRSPTFSYGAWIVANVWLRDRPLEPGFPMCWDNVIYRSKSLGYVNSTHQTGNDHGPTVLTWYYPLVESGPEARKRLLALNWIDWADLVLSDLRVPHPDIDALVERIDVMRWGHAMVQPKPGFIWSESRLAAAQPIGGIHFAGTDLSGIALLEEAFYHGVRAAEEVLTALNLRRSTLL